MAVNALKCYTSVTLQAQWSVSLTLGAVCLPKRFSGLMFGQEKIIRRKCNIFFTDVLPSLVRITLYDNIFRSEMQIYLYREIYNYQPEE